MTTWKEAERRSCRRPIEADEVAQLEQFGALVRERRLGAGLSRPKLAGLVGVHSNTIKRIEDGTRRTRPDVVEAIGAAIASVTDSDPRVLIDDLLATATKCLAPPSKYAERVHHRRAVRFRKARNHAEQARHEAVMAWLQLAGPALDYFLYRDFLAGRQLYRPARLPRIPIEYLTVAMVRLEPQMHTVYHEPALTRASEVS